MFICRFAFPLKFWNIFTQNVVHSDFNKSTRKWVKNPHFNVDKRYRVFVRGAEDSICTMACNTYERTETMLKSSLTLTDAWNLYNLSFVYIIKNVFHQMFKTVWTRKEVYERTAFQKQSPGVVLWKRCSWECLISLLDIAF